MVMKIKCHSSVNAVCVATGISVKSKGKKSKLKCVACSEINYCGNLHRQY